MYDSEVSSESQIVDFHMVWIFESDILIDVAGSVDWND